jgi:hypothetical protein
MTTFASMSMLLFWGMIAVLLAILYAIARFYQITSGQHSHYHWFAVPIVLFGVGAARYAVVGDFRGDAVGDALMVAGSLVLIVAASWLVRLMMGGRR